jgi:hypothetical protein
MVIFRLSVLSSEPCIFVISRPTIFEFWIRIEDYERINETFGFFDLCSISSEIELGLGHFQIKIFLNMFNHFSRHFPIAIKFRVDAMIFFGSSNHLKKWRVKTQNGGQNQDGRQA